MKAIANDLGRDIKMLEIVPLADLHIGDPYADMERLREKLDYIGTTPNAYTVLNGDIMNNATRTSVSDVYGESMKPMEQLQLAVKLFEPVKDKILGGTGGNHEFRTYKQDGIDLTALLFAQLGLEDKYCPDGALMFVRFGMMRDGKKETNQSGEVRKMCYALFANHGSGGGRKEGAKAIRLADMASIVDADIYVHSHTHLPMVMKQAFFRADSRNNTFRKVDKLFVNTAAFLGYGGYGAAQEYKPSSIDTPHIYLDGTCRRMTARV